jgi:hypothetical protein
MSFAVMRLVWMVPMTATEKVVAIRLADFAGDDGGSVFPSIGRCVADCNLSRRAVQMAFRMFEETAILCSTRHHNMADRAVHSAQYTV